MYRYFISLSYKGTNYHGWQVQNNAPTVQQEVNRALSLYIREDINCVGCGRTDTGVHARNFIIHFDSQLSDLHEDEKFVFKINRILNNDIAIHWIKQVKDDSHARFSPISRTYKYYISYEKEIFSLDYCWNKSGNLDVEAMNKACDKLFNYIDFTSFSKLHTDVKTNNCNIMEASWVEKDGQYIFTIKADRFLRNMVRAIVGTMIEVGKHKLSIDDFCTIIEAKNRSLAGTSVPASGLFLVDIEYPSSTWE